MNLQFRGTATPTNRSGCILASCKCASLRIHHPVKTEASINQLWFNTWQGIGIRPGVEYLRPKVSKRTNLKVKWLRVNFCQLYKSHVLKNRPHRKSNFLNEYLRFEHLTDPSGGATQMIKWPGNFLMERKIWLSQDKIHLSLNPGKEILAKRRNFHFSYWGEKEAGGLQQFTARVVKKRGVGGAYELLLAEISTNHNTTGVCGVWQ